jgi:LysR family glycine cleavage system transcriptional activator
MRRLPPLSALEAFVQAARLGSVKAAADALSLSSPALSRRIQALERFLDRPLFDRRHQGIRLNADGKRLLDGVSGPIDALALALEDAAEDGELMRLRLAVPPLFAAQRLIPYLSELRAIAPNLHIDIDTAPHGLARLDEGIDAAIAITTEVDPALHSRRIERERLVAIGPRGADGSPAFTDPRDLSNATIFVHRDLPETFDYWREAIGLPNLQPAAIDHFDSGQLILEAVAQGLGVAIMLDSHLKEARDERLAPLFGLSVESPYGYWFACRRSALARRPLRLFHDWFFGREQQRAAA